MARRFSRAAVAILAGLGAGYLAAAILYARSDLAVIDFHLFYESASAWRAGRDLYVTTGSFSNLNPPIFAVAFAPFTFWIPRTSLMIWQGVNLLACVAAATLIWHELHLPRTYAGVCLGIAAAGLYSGLPFSFEQGQPTGILTLWMTAAWLAHRHQHRVLSAALLGILIGFKPFFGCFFVIFAFRRAWSELVISAAAALASFAVAVACAGPAAVWRWIEVGRAVSWLHHPMNASLAGIISRAGGGTRVWLPAAGAVLLYTAATLRTSDDDDAFWLGGILTSIVVSPLGWMYYLPLAAGPLVAIVRRTPVLLLLTVGLIWPALRLISAAPVGRLMAVTVFSIPSWSMTALWVGVMWTARRHDNGHKGPEGNVPLCPSCPG